MRIQVLVTDAFGGHGGIAKFNRDLLSSLCAHPGCESVTAFPRLMPETPGPLPDKLAYQFPYDVEAKFPAYIWQTWKYTPAKS